MTPPATGEVSQLEPDRAERWPLAYKLDALATWLFVGAVVVVCLGLIAGVLQINAIVPAGIAANNAAPIDLSIGSATSQAGVTVAVQ